MRSASLSKVSSLHQNTLSPRAPQSLFEIGYEKRKNVDLLNKMEESDLLGLSAVQNYIPTYDRFFRLNATNFNAVNLNHEWYLSDILRKLYKDDGDERTEEEVDEEDDENEEEEEEDEHADEDDDGNSESDNASISASKLTDANLFVCQLTHRKNKSRTQTKPVFFKLAPLFDPYKYFCGKLSAGDVEWLKSIQSFSASSSSSSSLIVPPMNHDQFPETTTSTQSASSISHKFTGLNNAAYVDGFFVYLSSMLLHHTHFPHGVDFHGFFLGVKNNYLINIYDDFDYLEDNTYFQQQMGKLFHVDETAIKDYHAQKEKYGSDSDETNSMVSEDEKEKGYGHRRLHILSGRSNASSKNSCLSVKSIDDSLFEDVFVDDKEGGEGGEGGGDKRREVEVMEDIEPFDPDTCFSFDRPVDKITTDLLSSSPQTVSVIEPDAELQEITILSLPSITTSKTAQSGSTCSSRSSHTDTDLECEMMKPSSDQANTFCGACTDVSKCCRNGACRRRQQQKQEQTTDSVDEKIDFAGDQDDIEDAAEIETDGSIVGTEDGTNDDDDDDDSGDSGEPTIAATIPQFPVHVICMEKCMNTMDDLLMKETMKDDEIIASLLQVVMILITYQKLFAFTHNDLHTNNIMYNETDIEFIYYKVSGQWFKVPTYGRIFKIIDFGRAIYSFKGQLFCSDSFGNGNDASTQYNTEPFFDASKPRVDPNFSFDLSRLGCSLFDYVIHKPQKLYTAFDKCTPLEQMVFRWCLNDKGVNILYKRNGEERYPNFKLYKMIARSVHHLLPERELQEEIFRSFSVTDDVVSQTRGNKGTKQKAKAKKEKSLRIVIDDLTSLQ